VGFIVIYLVKCKTEYQYRILQIKNKALTQDAVGQSTSSKASSRGIFRKRYGKKRVARFEHARAYLGRE
jgi:hypothetical protein